MASRGYPKPGICARCGRDIVKKSAAQKYCIDCAELRKREVSYLSKKQWYARRKEEREKEAKRLSMKRANEERLRRNKKSHICTYSRTCVYGSYLGCEYFVRTGELRTYDKATNTHHHKVESGKCDLYKRNQGKKRIENACTM